MKTWSNPEVVELDINKTAYHILGRQKDGGFIGDGNLSGHNMPTGHDQSNCDWCSKFIEPTEKLS